MNERWRNAGDVKQDNMYDDIPAMCAVNAVN